MIQGQPVGATGGRVPQPDQPVATSRGEQPIVTAELDAPHFATVLQHGALTTCTRVPQPNNAVPAAGREDGAVAGVRHTVHLVRVTEEGLGAVSHPRQRSNQTRSGLHRLVGGNA